MIKEGINKQKMTFREGSKNLGGEREKMKMKDSINKQKKTFRESSCGGGKKNDQGKQRR